MEKINIVLIESPMTGDADAKRFFYSERLRVVGVFDNPGKALPQLESLHPHYILLDTTAVTGDMIAAIRALSTQVPGVRILCVATNWPDGVQQDCRGAGAIGFLQKPFSAEELLAFLPAATVEKTNSVKKGKVIVFFSPKGKSGKTNLIANLAVAAAEDTNKKIAIIDADVQFSDMAVFFNVWPATTIVEAVRDIENLDGKKIKKYFTSYQKRLDILCGPQMPEKAELVGADSFRKLLIAVQLLYDEIFVDLPAGFNPLSVTAAEQADNVTIMTMLNGAYEIKHMRRALDILRSLDDYQHKLHVVFTRVPNCTEEWRQALSADIGYDVAGLIPNVYLSVAAAVDKGTPLLEMEPQSPFAESVAQLLRQYRQRKEKS